MNAPFKPQEEEFFPIRDTDEWDAFWKENGAHLDMEEYVAFQLACNCGLLIGGGAAPLVRVGFVDPDYDGLCEIEACADQRIDNDMLLAAKLTKITNLVREIMRTRTRSTFNPKYPRRR